MAEFNRDCSFPGRAAFVACVAGVFLLTGCGFSPVYGTRASGSDGEYSTEADLNNIRVAIIEGREGQILHNFLLDRFHASGRPAGGEHGLSVELSISSTDLGTQIDATTTRSRLTLVATSFLSSNGTSVKFRSRAMATYSTSESDYASLVARENAIERSLQVIADDLRLQIATYFEKQRLLRG